MFSFTEENTKKSQELLCKYEEKRSALIPLLLLATEQNKSLSSDVLNYLSGLLAIPKNEVEEVARFYNEFFVGRRGNNLVEICTNVNCSLAGSRELLSEVLNHFEMHERETTFDNRFTVMSSNCLGHCEKAPCFKVNEQAFQGVSLKETLFCLEEHP